MRQRFAKVNLTHEPRLVAGGNIVEVNSIRRGGKRVDPKAQDGQDGPLRLDPRFPRGTPRDRSDLADQAGRGRISNVQYRDWPDAPAASIGALSGQG